MSHPCLLRFQVEQVIRGRRHLNGYALGDLQPKLGELIYGNTPAQRAELNWLLYNKPLEYAQLVLGEEMEHYLSLGCDHGRLED